MRTIFNFLGPLTNPAGARRQLIGVSDPAYVETMAGALALLGVERALVVSSRGRARRDEHRGTHHASSKSTATDLRTLHRAPGGRRADRPAPTATRRPAARRRTTPRRRARSSPASAGRGATSPSSTRARRSTPPAAPTTSPPASPPRRPRSTTARRRARSTRSSRARRSSQRRPRERPRADRRRDARGCAPPPRGGPAGDARAGLAARGDDRPFSEALTLPGVSVIAEHKRRSPSAGTIREGATVADVVGAYERGGAAALSILTEGRNFGGSLDDLREARAASVAADPAQGLHRRRLPALRVGGRRRRRDPAHRRRAGARRARRAATREARALDLDVLVEVHAEDELECALEVVDADVIGINNRDLADFSVDVAAHVRAAARRPGGQDRRLRVGLPLARRSSTSSSASASTACSSASRSCAPPTPRPRCAP